MTQARAPAPEQAYRPPSPPMVKRRAGLQARVKRALRWDTPLPRFPSIVGLLKRYLRWSRTVTFDVDLRYAVPVRFLRRNWTALGAHLRILDAGCGPYGLASRLEKECVGVDVVHPDTSVAPRISGILRVQASITALPFRDGSFDVVTSMDTIEHLSPSERPAAIRELFRVASRAIVLGVPFGPKSVRYDRLARTRELACGQEPGWRREHVMNGLPGSELDELVYATAAARGIARLRTRKHENLGLLKVRWRIGLALPQFHPAYGLVMVPLYAIAKSLHVGACYRKVYFAEFASVQGSAERE